MPTAQKSLLDCPTAGKIAEVVADIIAAVKRDHPGTGNAQLAVKLSVSKDTIDRLEDLTTGKVPASVISGISAKYGVAYIQPYMQLFGCKAVPVHQEEAINALPALAALLHKLAANARDGGGLDHQGLAAILPELREADGIISALRARASDLGLAA